jgi:hypothetical protein
MDAALSQAATQLLPLTQTPYRRSLLVATRAREWTAYIDAGNRGGDPRGAVSVLGRRLEAPHVVVYAVPFRADLDAIPGALGALQWEYAPDASAATQRVVSLVEGEGSSPFRFEAWGPPQAWESLETYGRHASVNGSLLNSSTTTAMPLGSTP